MATKRLMKDQVLQPVRRAKLVEKIKSVYPDKKGALILCASFDSATLCFSCD